MRVKSKPADTAREGSFNPKSLLVVDTETTGLDFYRPSGEGGGGAPARPFMISLCDESGYTECLEFPVDPFTREVFPQRDRVSRIQYRRAKELLEDPSLTKLAFNLKFDRRMLSGIGINLAGPTEDAYLAARVCNTTEDEFILYPDDPEKPSKKAVNGEVLIRCGYKLKPLAWKYAKFPIEDERGLQSAVIKARNIGKKKGWLLGEKTGFDYWMPALAFPEDEEKREACRRYAVNDVLRTLILWRMYEAAMREEPDTLGRIYRGTEMEFLPVVECMEERGIRINREENEREFTKLSRQLKQELQALRKASRRPAFTGTPAEIRSVLYDPQPKGLALPILKRTPSGLPGTDWKSLLEYNQVPFVRHLLVYRNGQKGTSTYYGAYRRLMVPDHINADEYCIHCSINQTDTKTGRSSSSDPNLQNVSNPETSIRTDNTISARVPFGPRKGYIWYCFDFAQQELVIFAELGQIREMIRAYLAGEDMHAANADRAWGGRGNEHALKKAAYSLELGNVYCDRPEVLSLWGKMDWNKTKASVYGYLSPESLRLSEQWLAEFGYSIVKSEKSIGSKRARSTAKSVVYAKMYGGGPKAVMAFLLCSYSEAVEATERMEEVFPGMRNFQNQIIAQGRKQGYIVTPYGRKLHVPPDKAYKGVNYLVQSSGADMMKQGAIKAHHYLRQQRIDAHPVLVVHDELIFEFREGHNYKHVLRGIKRRMEDTSAYFKLPIKVDVSRVTHSWADKREIEV